jgi:hypothetical protein
MCAAWSDGRRCKGLTPVCASAPSQASENGSDDVEHQQADYNDPGHAEHPQNQSLAHAIFSCVGWLTFPTIIAARGSTVGTRDRGSRQICYGKTGILPANPVELGGSYTAISQGKFLTWIQ